MFKVFNYNEDKKLAILGLKVKANSKIDDIQKFILINDKYYLKISTKSVPENGLANEAIINFLSKKWKISKSNIEIITGHTNSLKLIAIKNIDPDYLNLYLNNYIK